MESTRRGQLPEPHTLLDTRQLREQGRVFPTPFAVAQRCGGTIIVNDILRVIPGKRLVAEGELDGAPVLVKLFFSRRAPLHHRRELRGIQALLSAGIDTPALIDSGPLADGQGYLMLSQFIPSARTLDVGEPRASSGRPAGIERAFALVGQLHAAGLRHRDIHAGNFLQQDNRLFLLDGDAVDPVQPGRPLTGRRALHNLAAVAAMVPDINEDMIAAYHRGNPSYRPDGARLTTAAQRLRQASRAKDLKKTLRSSTRFSMKRDTRRFSVAKRYWRNPLAHLIDHPDTAMAAGHMLKDGGASTVVAVDSAAGPVVIKRYNIKGLWHGLRRLWRPSRACISWRAARLLELAGIHTPSQLAMIEERIGPLRRRAWLVSAHCPGIPLSQQLSPDRAPTQEEADALRGLLDNLWRERMSHGDLKGTNLLFHQGKLFVIDLDAVKHHRFRFTHRRAWRRDRQRLLDNWPRDSLLYRWLDDNLPRGDSASAVHRAGAGQLQYMVWAAVEVLPSLPL